MSRLYLALVAVLSALSLTLGYLTYSGGQEIAELRQTNSALMEAQKRATERAKLDRKALVARQAENASTARKLAQTQEALTKALDLNQNWATEKVPQEVQEALANGS